MPSASYGQSSLSEWISNHSLLCPWSPFKGHMLVLPAIILGLYWSMSVRDDTRECTRMRMVILTTILLCIGLLLAERIASGGVTMPAEMMLDPRYSLSWQDRVQLPLRYIGLLLYPIHLNHIYLVVLDEFHPILTVVSVLFSICAVALMVKGIKDRKHRHFFHSQHYSCSCHFCTLGRAWCTWPTDIFSW